MPHIPQSESDFTVSWISEALKSRLDRCRITDVDARLSDTPGQTAEIVNIRLSFDAEHEPLPCRLVAKVASRDPMIRDLVKVFGQYAREVKFYQQFPEVGIPVPGCYYCDHDPETQQMIILMDDLAPALSPSWAINSDQVKLAAEYLAPFHARWWNDHRLLDKDWLVQRDDYTFYHSAASAAAAADERIRELFGNSADYTVATVKKARDKADAVLAYLQERPFTLVHGDYHGKQMFFPSSDGGSFSVIDWQFPFVAQGAWDLVRIVSLGLTTAERQQVQDDLFDRYFDGLLANGVSNYSREDLEADIKLGAWINQNIMAIAAADTDPGILEAECAALGVDWREILLLRGDRLVQELDVLDFIDRL